MSRLRSKDSNTEYLTGPLIKISSSCVAHWFRFQCGPGSSILGQCGSESGFRDLITKYLTILQKIITHILLVNKCKYIY